jgi:hypothetical protein
MAERSRRILIYAAVTLATSATAFFLYRDDVSRSRVTGEIQVSSEHHQRETRRDAIPAPNEASAVEPRIVRSPQLGEPEEPFRESEAMSAANVRRFGEFVWPEVRNSSTLFFHRGKYLDAPYFVRTRGLAILVNDHVVQTIEWPGESFLAERPEVPDWVDETTTPHNLVQGQRLSKTWPVLHARWVKSHFAEPVEREAALLDAYEQLPFVVEVGNTVVPDDFVGHRTLLWFRTNAGEEKGIVYSEVAGHVPGPATRALDNVKVVASLYHTLLNSGDLEYRDGNLMARVPRDSPAWWWLPEVFEVLESDATPLNRRRKLLALLRDPRSGTIGSMETMVDAWLAEFEPTPQLREHIEQIRAVRPRWTTPPSLPEDIADPVVTPEPVSPDQAAREDLSMAITEMIELLEAKDFRTFVARYIRPEWQRSYNYDGATHADVSVTYDFDRQPELVEMYIQQLRWSQQLQPIIEGHTAIFTHWLGRGISETHMYKVGDYWYFQ